MVGTSSFSILFDRASGQFDVGVDYTIPGYNDPETGEQFYETNWNFTYTDPVYDSWFGSSGSGWDSGNALISIGFPPDEDATDAVLDFNAVNGFSGVEVFARLHILNAGLATRDVTLTAAADYGDTLLFGGSGDDLLTGAGGGDLLDGGAGDDVLIGGAGRDTLDGGRGSDAMEGGAGNDDYYVDDAGDVVFEVAGGGDDLVYAAVSTTLSQHVEKLVLDANGALDGTGNDLANTLWGNNHANRLYGRGGDDDLFGYNGADRLSGGAGSDVLNGGSGADTMFGGAGDDAYVVDNRLDTVTEWAGGGRDEVAVDGLGRYTLGREVEDLTNLAALPVFYGQGNALGNAMTGAAGRDHLFGLRGADSLDGGGGNDLLEGGAGADSLVGGRGTDTLSYASARGTVEVSLTSGQALGDDAQGDTFTGFENLRGGRASDALYGDAARNVIWGGAGSDYIDGAGGADLLIGGSGDDGFAVFSDTGADHIRDFAAGGSEDQLLISLGTGFDSTGEVLSAARQIGADTVFDFGGGVMIVLEGVSRSSLTAGDFAFDI